MQKNRQPHPDLHHLDLRLLIESEVVVLKERSTETDIGLMEDQDIVSDSSLEVHMTKDNKIKRKDEESVIQAEVNRKLSKAGSLGRLLKEVTHVVKDCGP